MRASVPPDARDSNEGTSAADTFRDQELADSRDLAAELLRTIAARWRFRIRAGRLGSHPIDETQRLVASLDAAVEALGGEPGSHTSPPRASGNDDRFQKLVDSIADYAIFMLTEDGTIASWNAGAQRIKGYQAEEIIGKHFSIFYPEEDKATRKPERELEVAVREGRYSEEGWRVRKHGQRFWAHVTITALRDVEGRLIGFSKVTRDVTELRNANEAYRQSEERFRLMVEAVRDYAIFMLDQGGHIASWNIGAERLKGYKAEEIIGKHFSIFYPEEARRRDHPAYELRRAIAEGRYEEEGYRVRKDGSQFWANVVITALFDQEGRHIGFTKVTRDFTEAKRLREAQLAVALRDEFLATAGHELRTPLAALLMQIQSLARSARIEDAKIKERLEKAASAGTRLEKLISQILDVSRINAGRLMLDRERMRLDQVIRDVMDRFADLAAESGCPVTLNLDPVEGVWDRVRLEQVITNLVSNALKYGKGRPIEIETRVEGPCAVLRVADRGIGISADDQKKIFERFERAKGTREYGGFGLGLWISRNIVEANGGQIWVESIPGDGSAFTVKLPLQPKEGDAAGRS
ncbi:MAG: PAS domain S-box protein [Myxococcales bacterium]